MLMVMMMMTHLPECCWPEASLKLEEKFNSGQRHRLPRPGHCGGGGEVGDGGGEGATTDRDHG